MSVAEIFRIPKPRESANDWHVSPLVDICAYALSWMWLLVPLAMMGPNKMDYIILYVVSVALADVHRHFTYPMVYLDKQVRRQYPTRFVFFLLVLLVLFVAGTLLAPTKSYVSTVGVSAILAYTLVLVQMLRRDGSDTRVRTNEYVPGLAIPAFAAYVLGSLSRLVGFSGIDASWWWLLSALASASYFDWRVLKRHLESGLPRRKRQFAYSGAILALMILAVAGGPAIDGMTGHGGFRWRSIFNTVAVFAGAWNFWHFYMQKYGYMRMYATKSRPKVHHPGWCDRFLMFCWVPLYFAYIGPANRDVVMKYFRRADHILPQILDAMVAVAWIAIPLSAVVVAVAIGLWLRIEWRTYRFRNSARLWMAGGTTAMGAAFLFVDPVKAYLAFAFSHTVEYIVFVWAYQRKRYRAKLPHDPPVGRILTRPVLAYGTFIISLLLMFMYTKYYGRFIFLDRPRPKLLSIETATWVAYYSIFQSMLHFYWDGFMWKMRLKSVRDNL